MKGHHHKEARGGRKGPRQKEGANTKHNTRRTQMLYFSLIISLSEYPVRASPFWANFLTTSPPV